MEAFAGAIIAGALLMVCTGILQGLYWEIRRLWA